MHRRKLFHQAGLGLYSRKSHILITFFMILLPFLFALLILPLSHIDQKVFLRDLFVSTIRLMVAYSISLFLAIVLGIGLTRGRLGNFFLPLFDVLQSFPTFALLPLILHIFGAGDLTVIIFLIITIIWPMLFAIISSLKLIRADWEEAATVFGARGWKNLLYFTLPISFPGVITGSIVGLGDGWDVVVGGEIIIGLQAGGLGSFFAQNSNSQQLVLFGVMALLLFVFSLNKIIWLPLLEQSHKLLTD